MTHSALTPLQLDLGQLPPLTRSLATLASPVIEWVLAFRDLNNCLARTTAFDSALPFVERALRALDVRIDFDTCALANIPATGSLIVVANHPFGGLDGLAALSLVRRRRGDVKILANHLLKRIPGLRDDCFFVDPFGGASATRRNIAATREAIRWVKSGGALVVFPAGEVSSFHLRERQVQDVGWHRNVGAIVRATNADVLPIFFNGRNSNAFQFAGMVSPRLRTLMLPRELLKKRGTRVRVQIGSVIPSSRLAQFESDEQLTSYLRVRTDLMSARSHVVARPQAAERECQREAIASEECADVIESEINSLPEEQTLASSASMRVCFADAHQIRATLREIGRLREITFRAAGEGTGNDRDLDRFDEHYLHLFAWDSAARSVIGAYRLALTDRVLATHGKSGLYTHTLFEFSDELLEQISPAIELGRSFVRAKYQKEYAPLMMLWKGIATFVARNPHYRNLIGPVTISNNYHSFTRQLLIEFLKINTPADDDLRKLVTPRNPPASSHARTWPAKLAATIVRSLDGIDELVGEIESDRCGMPVLLRQYLKLNAKLLAFNVDPDFGDCLDGLMLCDLTKVAPAVLVRYMGRSGAEGFLSHHERK